MNTKHGMTLTIVLALALCINTTTASADEVAPIAVSGGGSGGGGNYGSLPLDQLEQRSYTEYSSDQIRLNMSGRVEDEWVHETQWDTHTHPAKAYIDGSLYVKQIEDQYVMPHTMNSIIRRYDNEGHFNISTAFTFLYTDNVNDITGWDPLAGTSVSISGEQMSTRVNTGMEHQWESVWMNDNEWFEFETDHVRTWMDASAEEARIDRLNAHVYYDYTRTVWVRIPGTNDEEQIELHGFEAIFDADLTYTGDNLVNFNSRVAIPEPATMSLLALGAIAFIRRRRNS